MATGIKDFYRGDSQIYKLTIKDATGAPIDITGGTVWFTMKANPSDDDTEAVIQKSVTNHTDPVNGQTEIVLTSSDTSNLVPNTTYYYDFQYVDSLGNVKTLLVGKVKILQDITRSS